MLSWFAPLLAVGREAPDFTLLDDGGRAVSLSGHRGRQAVVLVFYPMDGTPGCTAQLCEIRDHWQEFERGGVAVYGVNPGSAASHAKFRTQRRYPFPLLVDAGKTVAALYGANGIVPRRTVYAVDLQGWIAFAERGKPAPERVLGALSGRTA